MALDEGMLKLAGYFSGALMFLGSIELRLRSKVSRHEFTILKDQMIRCESHQWDIMKAMKITPTMEPPEIIMNGRLTKGF